MANQMHSAFRAFLKWAKQHKDAKNPKVARQIEFCELHLKSFRLHRNKLAPLQIRSAIKDFAKLERLLRE